MTDGIAAGALFAFLSKGTGALPCAGWLPVARTKSLRDGRFLDWLPFAIWVSLAGLPITIDLWHFVD
jgi:hypothetical protein